MLRGKIVEFPALKVWLQGREIGREKGRKEQSESTAKKMLRDRQPISLIEDYTKLPPSRIHEIAKEIRIA